MSYNPQKMGPRSVMNSHAHSVVKSLSNNGFNQHIKKHDGSCSPSVDHALVFSSLKFMMAICLRCCVALNKDTIFKKTTMTSIVGILRSNLAPC
jgi:hypothetical protein